MTHWDITLHFHEVGPVRVTTVPVTFFGEKHDKYNIRMYLLKSYYIIGRRLVDTLDVIL